MLKYVSNLSYADPFLQKACPLLGLQLRLPQARRCDGVGQAIKLTHRGSDRPARTLVALLISLRPQRAQAVIRHQLQKQLLEDQGNAVNTPVITRVCTTLTNINTSLAKMKKV